MRSGLDLDGAEVENHDDGERFAGEMRYCGEIGAARAQ